jgi:hypothetical protein
MKVRCGFLCITRTIFDDFLNRIIFPKVIPKVSKNSELLKYFKNLNNEILLINSFWGME